MRCRRRKKAWIGAAISAATGIAGALIGNAAQAKAQREQRIRENKQASREIATNLTNAYTDQEYTNAYNDKLSFRTGGRFNSNKVSFANTFRCGGKRRK